MEYLKSWFRGLRAKRLDVFVDIDETLLLLLGNRDKIRGNMVSLKANPYGLAHGALEFLVALDKMPGVYTRFYSASSEERSFELLDKVVSLAQERLNHKITKLSVVQNDLQNIRKAKVLKGCVEGVDLERAILIDDLEANSVPGEERNLLKLYERVYLEEECTRPVPIVFELRRKNNLVRALGLILKSLEVSEASSSSSSVVDVLSSLQWDASSKSYNHKASNTEEIYQRGEKAMQRVNPEFALIRDHTQFLAPWSLI